MTDMNTSSRDFGADSDALMGHTSNTEETGKHRVGEKVRELASTAQSKAGEQVRSQLDSGKTRAATALRDVAGSLMHPNEEGGDVVSRYIRTAGDQVQRAADYLENTDVRDVMNDVERFARRQPALFLGGAFMLGLVAARVLKSSRDSGGPNADRSWNSSSMYDRERSLSSFREPESNFGASGIGAAGGAALGGAMLGDSELGGRSGLDSSTSFDSGGNNPGSTWNDDLGNTTRSDPSDPYANE